MLHWWTDEPRIRVVYEDLLVYEARMDFTSLVRPRNDIRGRWYEARKVHFTSLVYKARKTPVSLETYEGFSRLLVAACGPMSSFTSHHPLCNAAGGLFGGTRLVKCTLYEPRIQGS